MPNTSNTKPKPPTDRRAVWVVERQLKSGRWKHYMKAGNEIECLDMCRFYGNLFKQHLFRGRQKYVYAPRH